MKAKELGLRHIWVRILSVYGVFDESSRDFADDIRGICDRYITDFSELLED